MVSAEQAKLNQIAARERFLAGGGTQTQIDIGLLRNDIKRANFAINNLRKAGKSLTSRSVVKQLDRIKGLEDAIRKLQGLSIINEQITTSEDISPSPELEIELSVAEKGRKVQNMTLPASEIIRIRGAR